MTLAEGEMKIPSKLAMQAGGPLVALLVSFMQYSQRHAYKQYISQAAVE